MQLIHGQRHFPRPLWLFYAVSFSSSSSSSSSPRDTHLVRPFRTGTTQSVAHCRLVQLLQGRPTTAASHLTLRARQGTQALLAFRARRTLCRVSLGEAFMRAEF